MTVTEERPIEVEDERLLQPLTEEECYLAAVLIDQSGIDQAEFFWPNHSSSDGCFRLYPYQYAWWRDQAPRSIDQCVACGQEVVTERGPVPIEDVVVGDVVFTHEGRWRAVTEVLDNGTKQVAFLCAGSVRVALTPDHPVLTRRSGGDPYWSQVCELDTEVEVYSPTEDEWYRVESVSLGRDVPVRNLEVDEDHSFVVGGLAVHNCARDVGKSERVCARALAHPTVNPGEEHALIAPEGGHINRLTERIEGRISEVRLYREFIVGGLRGIKHNPFHIRWHSGAQTYSRLPQRSGLGVKGIHAVWLDVDEAQDISERTWNEIPQTVRFNDLPDKARWCCHGVSKGVHDEFFNKTKPGSGWRVYRITQMHKPTYSKEDRPQLLKEYGGNDESGDFKRNVYGEHGDTQNRIFLKPHYMACVDTRTEGSVINDEYYQPTIIGDEVAARLDSDVALQASTDEATAVVMSMLEFPASHLSDFKTFWCGMDVGIVSDPSEIVVLAEYVPDKRERAEHRRKDVLIAVPEEGVSRFRVLTRIRLLRVPSPLQADVVMRVIDYYKPKAFGLDAGGNGLPVFQELQKRAGKSRVVLLEQLEDDATPDQKADFARRRREATEALTAIKGYKFGSKLVVEFDEEKLAKLDNPTPEEMAEKAGIKQEAKTRATEVLRTLVDERRPLFPDDDEFTDQMNGQTFTYSADPIDAFGKRVASFSKGVFHILDAMRFFALAWSQDPIERILEAPPDPDPPVLDRFIRM